MIESKHSGFADRLSQAATEFFDTVAKGESPPLSDYATRYPEIADDLQRVLPALALVGDSASGASATTPWSQCEPQQLGDYRIVREIGRGGMGVVYEAEQLSLGRSVALKVLPFAAMVDSKQLNRFKNEARAAGTLDHPNIVSIYGVGVERGVHYYAMQLIDGRSLADVIAAMRLPTFRDSVSAESEEQFAAPSDCREVRDTRPVACLSTLPEFSSRAYFKAVARLGIQAAEALEFAHQNGVLHRDIKPANLILDGTGKLWITDFGLARIEHDVGMTVTGDLLGTLRYMSPEQSLGQHSIIDQRSDVYSLGITIYELLALEPAFCGNNRHELLRKIASEDPPKLGHKNSQIPQDLATIVLKSIDKCPAARYATAQQLADDLRRFVDDRPIVARRPNLFALCHKWSRRHPTATIVAACAIVLSLMLGVAVAADYKRKMTEASRFVEVAVRAADAALEIGDVAHGAQRLAEARMRVEEVGFCDQNQLERLALLEREMVRYAQFVSLVEMARLHRSGSEAGIAPAIQALELYRVTDDLDWLGSLRKAGYPEAHLARITEAAYELLLLRADHLTRWFMEWPEPTRQARLERQCREAVLLLNEAVSFHKPSRGYYWLKANCARVLEDNETEKKLRATALATPAHHAAELLYVNRDRVWGTVSHSKGYPKLSMEESYRDHREMLRLDPTYYNAMFFIPIRLKDEKRYAEALLGWYACVALRPHDWLAIFHRGTTHAKLGHFEEAKADYELVLSLEPSNPRARGYIAYALATDPHEAMRDGLRAIELATQACEATDYADPDMIVILACAHAEIGDYKAAVKWSEMAVTLCVDWQIEDFQDLLESFRAGKPWRDG